MILIKYHFYLSYALPYAPGAFVIYLLDAC